MNVPLTKAVRSPSTVACAGTGTLNRDQLASEKRHAPRATSMCVLEPRAAHGGGREGFARKEVPYDIAKFSLCSYGAPEERRDAHLDAEGAGRLAEDLAHEDIAAAPVGAVGPARVGHRIVRLRAFVGGCPLKNLAFSWPGSPREKEFVSQSWLHIQAARPRLRRHGARDERRRARQVL